MKDLPEKTNLTFWNQWDRCKNTALLAETDENIPDKNDAVITTTSGEISLKIAPKNLKFWNFLLRVASAILWIQNSGLVFYAGTIFNKIIVLNSKTRFCRTVGWNFSGGVFRKNCLKISYLFN